jgi:CHAT domain-containing protein/tetratricopeptide (TPR) repeat protein
MLVKSRSFMPGALCFSLLSFSLLNLAAQPQYAPQIIPAGRLELQRPVVRTLAPRTADSFLVTVEAGQFIHVVVEQKGADVALEILDPSGRLLTSMQSPTNEFGFEHASVIAAKAGAYQVRVVAKPTRPDPSAYRIELLALHAPLAEDQTRYRAEQILHSAMKDESTGLRMLRQRAIETYKQANQEFHALNEGYEEAFGWHRIGIIQSSLGDKQAALQSFAKALGIRKAIGDRPGEASTDSTIGLVYADLGDEPAARQSHSEAQQIRHALGDRRGEAVAWTNLGNVYAALGDYPEALRRYRQALDLFTGSGAIQYEAVTRNVIGIVYYRLGDLDTALKFYQEALKMRLAARDKAGRATTLNNIGTVYSAKGEPKVAVAFYQEATYIWTEMGDKLKEGVGWNNLCKAYADSGEREKALPCYERVLPIRRTTGDRFGEAATLSNLHNLFAASQPDLAIIFGKQAINVLQSIRRDNRGLELTLQQSYDKSVESYYRALAESLIGRGRFGEAEEVLNLLKEEEAGSVPRDSISDQLRAVTLLDEERQAVESYDRNVDRLVVLGQRQAALLAKKAQGLTDAELEESKQLTSQLGQAGLVLHRFFDEQEKHFDKNSSLARRIADFREAEALQDTLQDLGPDEVAIYTLVAPHQFIALLLTSGTPKAYSTAIEEKAFNDKIFRFRRQLEDPSSDPVPLAQELYGIVFPEGLRKDLDNLRAKTIMWSIDSTLRYIPIGALHDGKNYLVKKFRNSLITPASLAGLKEKPPGNWEGVGFGVSEGERPLPAVPAELKAVFRQSPRDPGAIPGTVRLNQDFTRAHFETDLARQRHSVVHIATHFDSRPGAAANSQLLLGDGPLNLAEIKARSRLFDHVQLLTLSACNTAFSNHNEDGREVDSFGSVAQWLGAKGIVASLWSVNDPATSSLMARMYQLLQKKQMTKTEALRQAQEDLLTGAIRPQPRSGEADRGVQVPSQPSRTQNGWRHPFYWAPFILIGNWK